MHDIEHVEVLNGVGFTAKRQTNQHTGYAQLEVTAVGVQATVIASLYLTELGYSVVMDEKDAARWPFRNRTTDYIWFEKEGDHVEFTQLPEAFGAKKEESKVEPTQEATEEPVEGESVEEVVAEESEENPAVATTEELLEGPNWSKAKTLSKQKLEDYADKWNIQLDTSNTKGEMLEQFEAEWESKVNG